MRIDKGLTKMERRRILHDCINAMWTEFSMVVDPKDAGRIGRVILLKDLSHSILAEEAEEDREEEGV